MGSEMCIRDSGNPYMHTIYDAFKFDAMGFDVGVQEVNKNWLDAGMNWSYLEETLSATQDMMSTWDKETQQVPQGELVDIGPNGRYVMMGHLLAPVEGKDGKSRPTNLINKFAKLLDGADKDMEIATGAARRVVKAVSDSGVDFRNMGDQVTIKQYRAFVRAVAKELDTTRRLSAMINRTNANKKELAKKIRRDGNLQYYAH